MIPNTIIAKPHSQPSNATSRRSGHEPNGVQGYAAAVASARPHGFPIPAAAASVLAHAFVIAILMNTPFRPPLATPEDTVISMRLLPRAAVEERSPAVDDPPPEARLEPDADAQPANRPSPEPAAPAVADADAQPTRESIPEPDAAGAKALRAALLDQVRALPTDAVEVGPSLPWTSSGASIPGVPGVRGWISGYVGTVRPSAQSWKDVDGTDRGRYVLANGTVVCTRRRAPTIDELMNPWKSIAVTMGSICGRERPGATDFSDPRVQPPPSVARVPSSSRE